MRGRQLTFHDHVQRLNGVIKIVHDDFFLRSAQQPARELDQPLGLDAVLGCNWRRL